MYFVPCWRERWKEFDWNKEVTKGWGESYFWRITPSHQHLLYFEFKFQAKPQVCTKHFTNNIFEIMKNYRKYDKDISDDGDQDEKNNCCLDMSIWTLSVTFFSMSHFGHLELHYGWFFTVWKLVNYLMIFYPSRPKTKTFLKIMVDYQLGPGVSPPLRLFPPLDGGKEDSIFRVEFTHLVSRLMKCVALLY